MTKILFFFQFILLHTTKQLQIVKNTFFPKNKWIMKDADTVFKMHFSLKKIFIYFKKKIFYLMVENNLYKNAKLYSESLFLTSSLG